MGGARSQIWRAKKCLKAIQLDWSMQARNILASRGSNRDKSQLISLSAIYGGFHRITPGLLTKFIAKPRK